MISGSLSSPLVHWLSENNAVFAQAFDSLKTITADSPDGIIPLGAPDFFVSVQSYDTRARSQAVWETHRQTIDLQVCLGGGELVDWTDKSLLTPTGVYVAEADRDEWASPQRVDGTVNLQPGTFVIFFAGEPHLPTILDGQSTQIKKAVVKIPAALFADANRETR